MCHFCAVILFNGDFQTCYPAFLLEVCLLDEVWIIYCGFTDLMM